MLNVGVRLHTGIGKVQVTGVEHMAIVLVALLAASAVTPTVLELLFSMVTFRIHMGRVYIGRL